MMTDERTIATLFSRLCLGVGLCLGIAACEDTTPQTGPSAPTESQPEPPATSAVGLFRCAQLTRDARDIDVLVDGNVVFQGLSYRNVSDYVELTEGEHRVQIFPARERRLTIVETNFSLLGGEAVTFAVVGRNPTEVVVRSDDRTTDPDRARVTLFNAVGDFPASFDLGVVNGPLLVNDVARFTGSPTVSLIPGVYALALLRGGSAEQLTTLFGVELPRSTASTVFAVGTLDRDDIELIVVRNAN